MLNLGIPHNLTAIDTITTRMLPRPLLQLPPVPTHPRLALARRRERVESCPARRIVCVANEILSERVKAVCEVSEIARERDLVMRFDDGHAEHSLQSIFQYRPKDRAGVLGKLTRQCNWCHALIK